MYIRRILEDDVLASLKNRKILFLLGARQVGKTTLIEKILETDSGDVLNMDTDIHRQRLLEAAALEPAEAVKALTGGRVLVIDEAQRVKDIGRITKSWYDAKVKTKIVLLGSSSATLLDLAASELVGRNEKLWLTPLLFGEVLAQQAWWREDLTAARAQEHYAKQVKALLMSRLVAGSYPEAYLTREPAKYLTNLTSDYLLKDIFTKSLVRSPEDVRRLLLELAQETGSTVSVNQLATRLKLSRQTIQRYLELLEGIFVIFKLPAYATDSDKEINKGVKYYFWDTGVKNALLQEWTISETRGDIDKLWENWVIAEIAKQRLTYGRLEDLFFWRSRHGSNVELVVKQGSSINPFTIVYDPDDASRRPSQSFASAYGVTPKTIHRDNVLEVLR